jgi:hypothetical protein
MKRPRSALIALLLVASLASSARADPEPDAPLADEPPAETPSAPERAPHPEPRVIVTVQFVRGPHAKKDVERAARIVRCYKASKQPKGALTLELELAGSGKVMHARRKRSSFGDKELTACLAKTMRGVPMPKARSGSTARIEIQLAPGDPPAR